MIPNFYYDFFINLTQNAILLYNVSTAHFNENQKLLSKHTYVTKYHSSKVMNLRKGVANC